MRSVGEGYGLLLNGNSTNIRVQNVEIDIFEHGIKIQDSSNISISDIDIEGCDFGISIQNSQNISIKNSDFHGLNLGYPINIDLCFNISIDLCQFFDFSGFNTDLMIGIKSTDTKLLQINNSTFNSLENTATAIEGVERIVYRCQIASQVH